ncbi:MAG: hypothetical protein U1E31_00185 [Rickettsiales bacterium]
MKQELKEKEKKQKFQLQLKDFFIKYIYFFNKINKLLSLELNEIKQLKNNIELENIQIESNLRNMTTLKDNIKNTISSLEEKILIILETEVKISEQVLKSSKLQDLLESKYLLLTQQLATNNQKQELNNEVQYRIKINKIISDLNTQKGYITSIINKLNTIKENTNAPEELKNFFNQFKKIYEDITIITELRVEFLNLYKNNNNEQNIIYNILEKFKIIDRYLNDINEYKGMVYSTNSIEVEFLQAKKSEIEYKYENIMYDLDKELLADDNVFF